MSESQQTPQDIPLLDRPKEELVRIIEAHQEDLRWYVDERNKIQQAADELLDLLKAKIPPENQEDLDGLKLYCQALAMGIAHGWKDGAPDNGFATALTLLTGEEIVVDIRKASGKSLLDKLASLDALAEQNLKLRAALEELAPWTWVKGTSAFGGARQIRRLRDGSEVPISVDAALAEPLPEAAQRVKEWREKAELLDWLAGDGDYSPQQRWDRVGMKICEGLRLNDALRAAKEVSDAGK